jgi:hypothetical protein
LFIVVLFILGYFVGSVNRKDVLQQTEIDYLENVIFKQAADIKSLEVSVTTLSAAQKQATASAGFRTVSPAPVRR